MLTLLLLGLFQEPTRWGGGWQKRGFRICRGIFQTRTGIWKIRTQIIESPQAVGLCKGAIRYVVASKKEGAAKPGLIRGVIKEAERG